MAIDKSKTKELINSIDDLFESVVGNLDKKTQKFLRDAIMGPALDEIKKLIEESRPPRIYLMGRSGHGKSSLINALANKQVAETNDVKPTTPNSVPYLITFHDVFSSWEVIDSRGIFETTRPDGASDENAIDFLKNDILKRKPDIILHVVACSECRNLENDFKVFEDIKHSLKKELDYEVPTVLVLNQADRIGNPREWPPEENAKKAGLLNDLLKYMAEDVLKCEYSNLDLNYSYKGLVVKNSNYIGIVPTSACEGDLWNIDALSDFIGQHLSEETLLNFAQAQRRKSYLKKLSSSLIRRFSTIAGAVGTAPIPIGDIVILTPLQMLLIAIIGGLSCRSFTKETALEYLSAAGVNLGAAFGVREIARGIVKLIPGVGLAVSGTVAASSTYALGKAAESYFFSGELKDPEEFSFDKKSHE